VLTKRSWIPRENSLANFLYVHIIIEQHEFLSCCLRPFDAQLIPGHEIVGIISQVGHNVRDFSVGDRCVVDNTILVGLVSYVPVLINDKRSCRVFFLSAMRVSIVAVVNMVYAKFLKAWVSQWQVDSLIT